MQAKQPRRATYADLEHIPETMTGEIIDGELVLSPRPVARHGMLLSKLNRIVGNRFEDGDPPEGGGWLFIPEVEIRIGGDAWVPDLAGWRRERLPTPVPDYPTIPPDWVCEILSPSTRRRDRLHKMPLYARAGIAWAWLVDPANRSIDVYRAVDTPERRWVLEGVWGEGDPADVPPNLPPFEAIELDLARLWV